MSMLLNRQTSKNTKLGYGFLGLETFSIRYFPKQSVAAEGFSLILYRIAPEIQDFARRPSSLVALGSPSITIYNVPALWASQVSLFTMFPRSIGPVNQDCSQKVAGCRLPLPPCSRTLGSPSITIFSIYSVPAPWAGELCLLAPTRVSRTLEANSWQGLDCNLFPNFTYTYIILYDLISLEAFA